MTIARRLIILVTVPLLALIGLGIFIKVQLARIETRSRFVAETQIGSLATLGNISRSYLPEALFQQVPQALLRINEA